MDTRVVVVVVAKMVAVVAADSKNYMTDHNREIFLSVAAELHVCLDPGDLLKPIYPITVIISVKRQF